MKKMIWISIGTALVMGLALMKVASATIFGVFDIPFDFDPNDVVAERTVTVGQTDNICLQAEDEDGVSMTPISIPEGMVLLDEGGTFEIQSVSYSWKLTDADVGDHAIVLLFSDLHESEPKSKTAVILVKVLPRLNAGPPVVRMCP